MRIFIIYGYILGFTFASPITRFPKCKEGLKTIDNTENNGAHQEETEHKEVQSHTAEILKIIPKMQSSLNYTDMQAKLNETRIKKQTSSNEIDRSSRLKYRYSRDLSQLIQKHPKRKTVGKKHSPEETNKIIQSHNLYNRSRKAKVNDMLKHKLEKGTIIKQLQKRSIDLEGTTNDPYHSPDISYDWDMQEDFNDDSQELNESASLNKSTEDFTLDIINENSDHTDYRESYPISSSESSNLIGSSETNNPIESNQLNSSNESSYNSNSEEFISDVRSEESISDVTDVKSEDSISDVPYKPIIFKESSNSQETSELNVQNCVFTTPVSDGLSESIRLSSDSWSQENSTQTIEHGKYSNSSDANDSSFNESSNSCTSNVSNHSTESTIHGGESAEHGSWYIADTVITDKIEANEIHT
ncbi:uncharacterized protein [Phyllobates terribilis]|uniref:uncharacterized protein n=1 Tax=Phyllobates terribilis TaxID=111132 RepID=UPI003CCB0FA7